jgi:putative phosphoesterase
MILGILSDTHDQAERTRRAVQMLIDAGAEALIHCGDITRPELLSLCAVRPLHFVVGNNDSRDIRFWKEQAANTGAVCLGWGGEISVAGKRIGITHGHLRSELRRLIAAEPDYLVSGHSHIAGESRVGKTRRINPGALYRARRFSVAVLDLEVDELRFLDVPR